MVIVVTASNEFDSAAFARGPGRGTTCAAAIPSAPAPPFDFHFLKSNFHDVQGCWRVVGKTLRDMLYGVSP